MKLCIIDLYGAQKALKNIFLTIKKFVRIYDTSGRMEFISSAETQTHPIYVICLRVKVPDGPKQISQWVQLHL